MLILLIIFVGFACKQSTCFVGAKSVSPLAIYFLLRELRSEFVFDLLCIDRNQFRGVLFHRRDPAISENRIYEKPFACADWDRLDPVP